MAVANLHTLDSDILCDLLTLCPDLTTLHCLIFTHPAIYHTFSSRRRLILKLVFRQQYKSIAAADDFITQTEIANVIDCVALREAYWPRIERLGTAKHTSKWATALLAAYHKAKLRDEALSFAKSAVDLVVKPNQGLRLDALTFARAVVRTYMAANLPREAMALQERVQEIIDPRLPSHSVWSKELVATHRSIGGEERVLQLQHSCWELYKKVVGPGSDVALDWARAIVREYQVQGKDQEALQFHQEVRRWLDPTTAPYVAWSRQLIVMLQRQKQDAEALIATEEVLRHLRPETTGYRAWTGQLSELYEAAGRSEDAIAVWKAAWTTFNGRLVRDPNSNAWKYPARGAGLMLAKAYRRHQRLDDANSVEAKCKEFEP